MFEYLIYLIKYFFDRTHLELLYYQEIGHLR